MNIVKLTSEEFIFIKTTEISNLFFLFMEKINNGIHFIDIKIEDTQNLNDSLLLNYKDELTKIADFIFEKFKEGIEISVDVITDVYLKDSIEYKPNLYISKDNVSLSTEFPNEKIDTIEFKSEEANICKYCYAFHCKPNPVVNLETTGDINIPPSFYCKKSLTELSVSRNLQLKIKEAGYNMNNDIVDTDYKELIKNSITMEGNTMKGVSDFYGV